ncbi:unnamed protein product [Cyprideis torosa]|uniref:Uncharacterized protein n=1 Tax=Cyprideis torosa TaxID=163714 RepID=A0A7R8WD44_9CRUS|nr:unnamed protein product [Cyprideis torosa]CAG0892764.1 unnamed protein product [Cyprideis torosa]
MFEGPVANRISVYPLPTPLEMRVVRLMPKKWRKDFDLQVKFDVLGCGTKPQNETKVPPKCESFCPGIPSELEKKCPMACPSEDPFWDGKQCVPLSQCPCYDRGKSYGIGESYLNGACDECLCLINGTQSCFPRDCSATKCAKKTERPVAVRRKEVCSCECQACPEDQRVCPQTNSCLKPEVFCDHCQKACSSNQTAVCSGYGPDLRYVTDFNGSTSSSCEEARLLLFLKSSIGGSFRVDLVQKGIYIYGVDQNFTIFLTNSSSREAQHISLPPLHVTVATLPGGKTTVAHVAPWGVQIAVDSQTQHYNIMVPKPLQELKLARGDCAGDSMSRPPAPCPAPAPDACSTHTYFFGYTSPCMDLWNPDLFGKCHETLDPDPFVKACLNSTCPSSSMPYPAIDLRTMDVSYSAPTPMKDPVPQAPRTQEIPDPCFFMETYAQRCSMLKPDKCPVADWRKTSSCPLSCSLQGSVVDSCYPPCDNPDGPETCDSMWGSAIDLRSGPSQASTAPSGVLMWPPRGGAAHNPSSPTSRGCSFVGHFDACLCPDDLVERQGKCVKATDCIPCEDDLHYPGDSWSTDDCLNCHCSAINGTTCVPSPCPSVPDCPRGTRLIESFAVNRTGGVCCSTYQCVPVPKNCTLSRPICGKDQRIKENLSNDSSVCPTYTCECLPEDQCPPPSERINGTKLLPGEVHVLNTFGCCPYFEVKCEEPPTCPPDPICNEFEIKVTVPGTQGHCCPAKKCELPPDTCVFKTQRNSSNPTATAYKVGDTWKNGPCQSCRCLKVGGASSKSAEVICDVTKCEPIPNADADSEYVISYSTDSPDDCCPTAKKTACKDDEGKTLKAGQYRLSKLDPCVSFRCESRNHPRDQVQLETNRMTCPKNCSKGWALQPPEEGKCCGRCKQIACIDQDGGLRDVEEKWPSDDACTTFTCVRDTNFGVFVMGSSEVCSSVADCPAEDIIQKGCCKVCNRTTDFTGSMHNCIASPLALNDTVGLFSTFHPSAPGVTCSNPGPVKGVNVCLGFCQSGTHYNNTLNGEQTTECNCCQPEDTTEITVPMTCPALKTDIARTFTVPKTCTCRQGCPVKSVSVRAEIVGSTTSRTTTTPAETTTPKSSEENEVSSRRLEISPRRRKNTDTIIGFPPGK